MSWGCIGYGKQNELGLYLLCMHVASTSSTDAAYRLLTLARACFGTFGQSRSSFQGLGSRLPCDCLGLCSKGIHSAAVVTPWIPGLTLSGI
jgi:hypothetical protein